MSEIYQYQPMKKQNRIIMVSGFTTIALILSLVVGMIIIFNPALTYRATKADWALFKALRNNVKAGDAYDRVILLIGQGDVETKGDVILNNFEDIKAKNPALYSQIMSGYPEGIEVEDVFTGYRVGTQGSIELQFRDSHLINYDPRAFSDANYALARQGGIVR